MMRHLENRFNIDSFLKYILNFTDNKEPIKDSITAITRKTKDYIKFYDK